MFPIHTLSSKFKFINWYAFGNLSIKANDKFLHTHSDFFADLILAPFPFGNVLLRVCVSSSFLCNDVCCCFNDSSFSCDWLKKYKVSIGCWNPLHRNGELSIICTYFSHLLHITIIDISFPPKRLDIQIRISKTWCTKRRPTWTTAVNSWPMQQSSTCALMLIWHAEFSSVGTEDRMEERKYVVSTNSEDVI